MSPLLGGAIPLLLSASMMAGAIASQRERLFGLANIVNCIPEGSGEGRNFSNSVTWMLAYPLVSSEGEGEGEGLWTSEVASMKHRHTLTKEASIHMADMDSLTV